MFTRVQALRYRCLRSIDQKLGTLEALVGPNASGKTTFLDVIGFLGDLMKPGKTLTDVVLERSPDFYKLLWIGEGSSFEFAVEAEVPGEVLPNMLEKYRKLSLLRYRIKIALDRDENEIVVAHESLWLLDPSKRPELNEASDDWEVFRIEGENESSGESFIEAVRILYKEKNHNGYIHLADEEFWSRGFLTGRQTSALANLPEDLEDFHAARWFRNLLSNGVQSISLDGPRLREPSSPGRGKKFQPDGSNLPFIVEDLRKHPERFAQWLDHVRTALPDIQDIQVIDRPEDRHRYLMIHYRGGAKVPSWLASDGTLRLLALTVIAYLPDFDGVYLIEEPETGIHPRALETVIQSLSSIYDGQVLLATHSPIVLGLLKPEEILCFSKDADGATEVISGDHHPALRDWKRGQPSLGVLFASGILS